jgi:hypothetical protein
MPTSRASRSSRHELCVCPRNAASQVASCLPSALWMDVSLDDASNASPTASWSIYASYPTYSSLPAQAAGAMLWAEAL